MSPVAGWYPDPSSSARLRWWDGTTWTDDTRDRAAHTAPPPPGTATGAPPTPPPAPGATGDPGPAQGANPYGGPAYGSDSTRPGGAGAPFATGSSFGTDSSYGAGSSFGTAAAGSSAGPAGSYGYGFGGGGGAPAPPAPPAAVAPNRAWLSWASIGAAIAVALAVIVILSVSLLGQTSKPPSSQGLSATTTAPSGPAGTVAPTSTAPTTTTVPPPPDSQPFADPGGVYTIAINPAWQTPATSVVGIQAWYLTGVNYGGYRSTLAIAPHTFASAMPLAQFAQTYQHEVAAEGWHVDTTSNITLADGTPAVGVIYTITVEGQLVTGETILAVKGVHGASIAVTAASNAAGSTFSLVDPYIQTLHLN